MNPVGRLLNFGVNRCKRALGSIRPLVSQKTNGPVFLKPASNKAIKIGAGLPASKAAPVLLAISGNNADLSKRVWEKQIQRDETHFGESGKNGAHPCDCQAGVPAVNEFLWR
jgi:hypothetical protein